MFVSGSYDYLGDGFSETKSIKVIKDEVLAAVGQVLDVEEILHGVPDKGVETVTGSFNTS